MKNSIIGLTPPPPFFLPKLWKILKNINYFMASKSGLVLKKKCIFLNYGICITDPSPYQLWNFP